MLRPLNLKKNNDKKAKEQEAWLKDSRYKDILIKLDPFYELEKTEVKKIHEEVFENFEGELRRKVDNIAVQNEIGESEKERAIKGFKTKFDLKKMLEFAERELQDASYYNTIVERNQKETEEEIKKKFFKALKIKDRLSKAISNIEIQLRFNQGQVELPIDEPIPRLANAILIKRSLIEQKNKEIKEKGNLKIEEMKKNYEY